MPPRRRRRSHELAQSIALRQAAHEAPPEAGSAGAAVERARLGARRRLAGRAHRRDPRRGPLAGRAHRPTAPWCSRTGTWGARSSSSCSAAPGGPSTASRCSRLSPRALQARVGRGYSVRNLRYFRSFYQAYSDREPSVRDAHGEFGHGPRAECSRAPAGTHQESPNSARASCRIPGGADRILEQAELDALPDPARRQDLGAREGAPEVTELGRLRCGAGAALRSSGDPPRSSRWRRGRAARSGRRRWAARARGRPRRGACRRWSR